MLRLERQRGHRQGRPGRSPLDDRVPRRADRADPPRVRGAPRCARARSRLGADAATPSAVPDVLAPSLAVVFCGINPGPVLGRCRRPLRQPSQRLLATARTRRDSRRASSSPRSSSTSCGSASASRMPPTGRLPAPATCAAETSRAVPSGSRRLARDLRPGVIAFVGKEAYRGAFRERPEHGLQERRLGETALFVLPSTSPANAAVPWEERLRWFRELRKPCETVSELRIRPAARAVVVDPDDRDPARPLRVPREESLCRSSSTPAAAARSGRAAGGRDPA